MAGISNKYEADCLNLGMSRQDHASCALGSYVYVFYGVDGNGMMISGQFSIERIDAEEVLLLESSNF